MQRVLKLSLQWVATASVLGIVAGCGSASHSWVGTHVNPAKNANTTAPQIMTNVTEVANNVQGTANVVAANFVQNDVPVMAAPVSDARVAEIFAVPPGTVALTFDDGPSPYTMGILHVLEQYHVKASFFFVGSRVKDWPNAVRQAALDGDTIGDHSVSHPVLTKLSPALQAWQIFAGAKEIQQYDPYPITLFRPPYEAFNQMTDDILAQNHMALALWNRDPRDWAAKTPQQIIQNVMTDHPSGGLFDMHDTALTLQALPQLIQDLQAQHLQFVVMQAPSAETGITLADVTMPPVPSQLGTTTVTPVGQSPGTSAGQTKTGNTTAGQTRTGNVATNVIGNQVSGQQANTTNTTGVDANQTNSVSNNVATVNTTVANNQVL